MNANEIADQYSDAGEHPKYTVDEWENAKAENSTDLSYWDWVAVQIESE